MTRIYVTWCIHLVNTHVSLGSFILLTLICDMTHRIDKNIWYDSYICDMIRSSRWHSYMTGLVHPVITHMWHDSSCWQFYLTWLIYMWQDSFISLKHICDITHRVDNSIWRDSYICDMIHSTCRHSYLTELIHRVDTYMWHDSLRLSVMSHIWRILCAMTHSYVCHMAHRILHMCDMTPFWHTYMWHDSLRLSGMSHMWRSPVTCINESYHRYETVERCCRHSYVTWFIFVSTLMRDMCHSSCWHTCVTWLIAPERHVTHMKESCRMCIWVMSQVWKSHVAHIRMRHDTHVNEACHTYEGVMSHLWMSHGTHMNESCHTYEGVMSHTYEWVMARMWMIHVTHMNESCRTHTNESYGVATISRLLKMICVFCRI